MTFMGSIVPPMFYMYILLQFVTCSHWSSAYGRSGSPPLCAVRFVSCHHHVE